MASHFCGFAWLCFALFVSFPRSGFGVCRVMKPLIKQTLIASMNRRNLQRERESLLLACFYRVFLIGFLYSGFVLCVCVCARFSFRVRRGFRIEIGRRARQRNGRTMSRPSIYNVFFSFHCFFLVSIYDAVCFSSSMYERVLFFLGYIEIDWVSLALYRVWLGCDGFYFGLTGFYMLKWIQLGFTGIVWLLLDFIGFNRVPMSFTGFLLNFKQGFMGFH